MGNYFLRNPDTGAPLEMRENQKPFAYSPYYATFGAGGWGSRKTWAGIGFCDQSIWMNPGCTGIVMAPTYKLTRELINNYIKPALIDMIIGESLQDNTLYLADGGRIIYLSAHIPERIEMYKAAWAYLDEGALMKEEVYKRIVSRLRDARAKKLRLGITSVPHWCWLRDKFEGQESLDRKILRLRTDDNTDLHPDAAQRIRESTTARMAPCHLDGQWVTPGGTVHPEFGEHNFITWPEYHQSFEIGCVIDWSPRSPHVLFFQMLPPGTVIEELRGTIPNGRIQRMSAVIIDEIWDVPDDPITTPRLCEYIKAKRYSLTIAIGDPAGKAAEATSGTNSMAQARQSLGLPIRIPPTAMRGKAVRVEHVNLALAPLVGHPTLFIAKHLEKDKHPRSWCSAVRAYSYRKDKEGIVSDEINEDGISEHAMDCTQYLVSVMLPTVPRLTNPRPRTLI